MQFYWCSNKTSFKIIFERGAKSVELIDKGSTLHVFEFCIHEKESLRKIIRWYLGGRNCLNHVMKPTNILQWSFQSNKSNYLSRLVVGKSNMVAHFSQRSGSCDYQQVESKDKNGDDGSRFNDGWDTSRANNVIWLSWSSSKRTWCYIVRPE